MPVTVEQLRTVSLFAALESEQLRSLLPGTAIAAYPAGDIVLHKGDRLPSRLFVVFQGSVQIQRIATTGKETIFRQLGTGEIFAAPAVFGNGIAPATVVAQEDCQVLTLERSQLLTLIQQSPEVALRIISVLNDRIQAMHQTIHGLVSERAIVRLAQFIQRIMVDSGVEETSEGQWIQSRLPYYQIARSIGITYEECVRLCKQMPMIHYHRGGKILVTDAEQLRAIAQGKEGE